MANRTDPSVATVHGTNPQFLIEKILRQKIYNDPYWKEHCFALTAESVLEKAVELDCIGGAVGGVQRPTPFICLLLKLLQIMPEKDIIVEYLKQDDFKYVRALGAMYFRMVGKAVDVYNYLEPLLNDYRRLRQLGDKGFEVVYMDDFVDKLLNETYFIGISLPRIAKRSLLEDQGVIESRISALQDELVALEAQEEIERENAEKEKKRERRERKESRREERRKRSASPRRSPGRRRSREREGRDRDRDDERYRGRRDDERYRGRRQSRSRSPDDRRGRGSYRSRRESSRSRSRSRSGERRGGRDRSRYDDDRYDRDGRDRRRSGRRGRSRSFSPRRDRRRSPSLDSDEERRERRRDDRRDDEGGERKKNRPKLFKGDDAKKGKKEKKEKDEKSGKTQEEIEIEESNKLRASLGLAPLKP
mmetsp:Transcript_19285/g.49459  ORF Transcript_19285/g.49459 Transcript_19285/m.49459 type:complete len:419 (+) Transcript_19285:78-1334(+)